MLRCQVGLVAAVFTMALKDQLLRIRKINAGKCVRRLWHLRFQQRKLAAAVLAQVSQHGADELAEQCHDSGVVLDETQLNVKADVLVQVTGG